MTRAPESRGSARRVCFQRTGKRLIAYIIIRLELSILKRLPIKIEVITVFSVSIIDNV